MAKNNNLSDLLKSVADAIRAKKGTTELINPQDFDAEIASIHGGTPTIEEKDVNFYDFDGALVASYTIEEAQALTQLPSAPDHSQDEVPLTFDEWNWTLSEIKVFGRACDVGAIFHPTDGNTHILCDYDKPTEVLLSWRSIAGTITYTIDWGDGEKENGTTTASTFTTKSHVYKTAGKYHVILTASDKYCIGGVSNAHFPCDYAYLSSLVTQSQGYAFNGAGVKAVTLPNNLTALKISTLGCNANLRFLAFPRSLQIIESGAVSQCMVELFSLHPRMTTIFNLFYQQSNLRRIIIPDSVTSMTTSNHPVFCARVKEIVFPVSLANIGAPITFFSLEKIEIRGINTQSTANAFGSSFALREIHIPQGWVLRANCNFTYSYAMTREAFVDFFSHLGNGTATITLGAYNLNKLTAEDKAIATAKGYTLA